MRQQHPVIFFDGVCNLCNGVVQFVLNHDKKARFKFSPLQSDYAQKKLHGKIPVTSSQQSMVLYANGKIYRQSTAALKIAKGLSGGWKLWAVFLLLPKFLRNPVYRFIARHRYKWFGKRKNCMIPSPELKQRFLE